MTTKDIKLALGQNRMRLIRLQRQTLKLRRRMATIRPDGKQRVLRVAS